MCGSGEPERSAPLGRAGCARCPASGFSPTPPAGDPGRPCVPHLSFLLPLPTPKPFLTLNSYLDPAKEFDCSPEALGCPQVSRESHLCLRTAPPFPVHQGPLRAQSPQNGHGPPLSSPRIGVGSLPASEARGEEAAGRGCPGPARGRGPPHLRRRRLLAALRRPGERRWVQARSAAARRDPALPRHGPGACSPAARRCGRPGGAQGGLRPALSCSRAAPLRVPPGSQPDPRAGWAQIKTRTRGRAGGLGSARIPKVAPSWGTPDAQ